MSVKLLKSTAVVSAMTLLSRVFGFVRDMVMALTFGAGAATDVFFVVFRITNFMRQLFAEGAFSQAFVPVLAQYKAAGDARREQVLLDSVAGTLGGVLFVVSLVGVVAAPALILVAAPGFYDEPAKYRLGAELLRLTFPYLLFISLTAFAGAILNAYGRFAVPAFTPVWLNVVLIGAMWWVAPHLERPIMALAGAVFVAGLVQLGFQLPFLYGLRRLPRPRWGWAHDGVRKIVRLMGPAVFGASVAQINLLFDIWLASLLVTGSISWLYYSDRLLQFPLGVIAIALATVILPTLSRLHAHQDRQAFMSMLDWGLRWALVLGAPAAIALLSVAGPLLTTLFYYGEFSAEAVYQARLSLMAYAIGLPGFMLIKVLTPGYFARQDTKTPVRAAMIAIAVNAVLSVALIAPLAHVGLALATSLSAYVNVGLLLRGLWRDGVYRRQPGWWGFGARLSGAGGLLAAGLWWWAPETARWMAVDASQRALWMLVTVAGGVALYAGALWMLGVSRDRLWVKPTGP